MNHSPVLARLFDDPRLESLVADLGSYLRDVLELWLAKLVFDRTGSTDGLDGYTRLVAERRGRPLRPKSR
jgi:hypothetical protein